MPNKAYLTGKLERHIEEARFKYKKYQRTIITFSVNGKTVK
jgi:hypothetical protein